MPGRQIFFAIFSVILTSTQSFSADEELPTAWRPDAVFGDKANPVRIVYQTLSKKSGLATKEQLLRDMKSMVKWRDEYSDFAKLAADRKLVISSDNKEERYDMAIASVWFELRLGHPRSKTPALSFDKPIEHDRRFLDVVKNEAAVQFNSKPVGATIVIEGEDFGFTNTILGLNKDLTYTFELKLENFPTYKKTRFRPRLCGIR